MSIRHLLRFSGLAFAASCASEGIPGPPAGLPYAAATAACGPADGPAIAIYLAPTPVESLTPQAPYVRIAIWQPLDSVTGRSWRLADGGAAAWYFSASNDFELATSGSVRVNVVDSDSTVGGSTVLTFPTAGRIMGGFRAGWIPSVQLCG